MYLVVICDPPVAPLNGFLLPSDQSEWIEGENVTYRCDSGFRLVGIDVVTCMERNSFEEIPECEGLLKHGLLVEQFYQTMTLIRIIGIGHNFAFSKYSNFIVC